MKKILIFCMILIIAAGLSGFSVDAYYYKPVKAEIEVEITLGGSVTITPNMNCPVPEKAEMYLQDGEIGKFDIDFTKVGIYDYVVRTIPDERQLDFDKTVYNIKIYVTDEDGELAVTFIVSTGGNKYGDHSKRLLFVNTVPESEKTPPNPKAGDNPEMYFWLAMLVSAGLLALSVINTQKNIK